MKKKVILIYDNRNDINSTISKIVALNSYGDIIYKRQKLQVILQKIMLKIEPDIEIVKLNIKKDVEKLINSIDENDDIVYMHIYSSSVITNEENFKLLLEKAEFVHRTMITNKENPTMIVFKSALEYKKFLQDEKMKDPNCIKEKYDNLPEISDNGCLQNISVYDTFLKFFSGGFEARHFNSLTGNDYIVTKTSTNKKKAKAEHDYFYLIPDYMKSFFVVPFNYVEDDKKASYSMERLKTPDLALQWVHEAISIKDFETLLDKIFFFINLRAKRDCTKEKYKSNMEDLYINKVEKRIKELKELDEYKKIENVIKLNESYKSIDEIYDKYKKLYDKMVSSYKFKNVEVIGHGDLCFSNMLYYKDINLLKFIDVKGATKEEDLWTDPYYDLAKLSHSICGNYDFFNYDMVEINMNQDLNIDIKIEKRDTTKFINLFKDKLEENGFNYKLVRLFEASLFLSMLPLHIDNVKKVVGFIMNAIHILEEVESLNGK